MHNSARSRDKIDLDSCRFYMKKLRAKALLMGKKLNTKESVFCPLASFQACLRHTYTCVLQCSHTSVGLAQAHPNKILRCIYFRVVHKLVCLRKGKVTYAMCVTAQRAHRAIVSSKT